ncbi:assimilatory sulfite reductase (NADPH) hemoprotein subunit [Alkalitalea saponilacus]|uniref:assimilatory sulfite reductase (NADPH) n=1 Tax=Alkalitalea saponilacus TaxID=889453 RepID=A0A1T5HHS5_9BACT|nr:assimilatory sulfite reductase (NADPH) hemoprotein subunit [Alkalitalea saponilacus]ASB48153.1 sulfite reductase subunit beta [Alkalitalea saponilacus]SKC20258.1 sulfite reductase (NADPH) hemoprotein beta-component [Alkalitalea saponilacus]
MAKLPDPIEWKPSPVEHIKIKSDFLRGTIKESLADETTGSISKDDTQLIKFHGSYQQTDRDLDAERKKQKLEPLFSFMIRARVAAGIATADQWLVFDRLAVQYGNGTMKLTTRQTFQWHGILKRNLKKTMQGINSTLVDTIAACGDVNRNVMGTSNEALSPLVPEVAAFAKKISDHLLPKTTAYHEIWLDKKLITEGQTDDEPLYGKTYLPRKFKIALAVPPYNDTDIFANDIGLIAIGEGKELKGFNVAIGGGMGMTFGNEETYPRLADIIGYVPKEDALKVIEEIVKVQRDYGNRENRKLSRLKYTVDRLGTEVFKQLVEERSGITLQPAIEYEFKQNGDVFGWMKAENNKWYLGLFVEHGRVKDVGDYKLKSALRDLARIKVCDFRLTGNQGLVLGRIDEPDKAAVEKILKKYNVYHLDKLSGLRKHAIACVALNTCTLAFAEAERYLPKLNTKIEAILKEVDLTNEDILIRMTGCPNGCGRPFLGEIGLVGRSLGKYNLYLGAGFSGERLNTLYKEMLDEQAILAELSEIIPKYAEERNKGERFGDFVVRKGIVKSGQTIKTI